MTNPDTKSAASILGSIGGRSATGDKKRRPKSVLRKAQKASVVSRRKNKLAKINHAQTVDNQIDAEW